jgi:hypothetical protein
VVDLEKKDYLIRSLLTSNYGVLVPSPPGLLPPPPLLSLRLPLGPLGAPLGEPLLAPPPLLLEGGQLDCVVGVEMMPVQHLLRKM